jgi:hypothetical protein
MRVFLEESTGPVPKERKWEPERTTAIRGATKLLLVGVKY